MTVAVREVKNAGLLILKHALASRPSGPWNDDDYDVLADGVVIGRDLKCQSSARRKGCGCGRCYSRTTRTPRQHTVMRRRTKSWRRHNKRPHYREFPP
jgi:hypothetical protein